MSTNCISKCTSCCTISLSILFWTLSLIFYMLELMFGIWSAILYYQSSHYGLFSVVSATILIPTIVLTIVSILWYYDQDRLYKLLQEAHPNDEELMAYKRLIGVGSIFTHFFLFGQVYRYGQLIILLLTRSKSYDIITLHRDSALLKFLHGFLTSAPLVTTQLYALAIPIMAPSINLSSSPYPITAGCLIAASISLLLTLVSYVASDRLHSEQRRVVIPGYIVTFLWHLCIVLGRIFALVLFTLAHGPYIGIVAGVHWIGMGVWTLAERTNFCGDLSMTPPKKRYQFEIPFALIVSFIFTFIFFNARDGSTLARIIIYHLLTSVETLVISALFYAAYPNLHYSPWAFAITMALYLLGMSFMFLYYAAWHPNRTDECFMIGCPRSCDCCHCFHKESPHIGNVDLPLDEGRNTRTPDTCIMSGRITDRQPVETLPETPDNNNNNSNNVRETTRTTNACTITQTPIEASRRPNSSVGYTRPIDVDPSLIRRPHSVHEHHKIYSLSHVTNNSVPSLVTMGTRGTGSSPVGTRQVGVVLQRGMSADNIKVANRHSSGSQYNYRINTTQQINTNEGGFVRTKSERLRHKTTPPTRSVTSPRHTHHRIVGLRRPSLVVADDLPSPIGEESDINNTPRKFSAPPKLMAPSVIITNSNERLRLSTVSSPSAYSATPTNTTPYNATPYSVTPINATPTRTTSYNATPTRTTPYNVPPSLTHLSPYSIKSHGNGKLYLEPTYSRRVRNGYRNSRDIYDTPRPLSRHRSLSPEARSSEGSGCGHSRASPISTRSTPGQSPAHRKRRKRSSNPLHIGDPMLEFTKLYTTASPAHISRSSLRPSDDSDGGGVVSSGLTSSYVMSSDNKSDVTMTTNVGGAPSVVSGTIDDNSLSPRPFKNVVTKGLTNRPFSTVSLQTNNSEYSGTLV